MEYINKALQKNREDNVCIDGGLGIALKLTNQVIGNEKIKGHFIRITSILGEGSSGLFVSNEMTTRGVRITMNMTHGCGRLYFGDCIKTPYPHRNPIDSLEPEDYEEKDIEEVAERVVDYLIKESYESIQKMQQKVNNEL